MQENSYQFLLKKLNEFIRKYYVNQTIRGLILFFSLAFILFLLVTILEYFGQFSSTVRTFLFYSFTCLLFTVFAVLIVLPLLKILSIGKKISHKQASQIIGKHFQEVNDKLFNILQLNDLQNETPSDLISASINQKISELKPIPFGLAINLKDNVRYLRYLLIPAIIIIGLAAFEPKIIVDSTNRLVDHQVDFIPSAPYQITITNSPLTGYKNEDFRLKIDLSGDEVPNNLNIIFEGQRFLMQRKGKHQFEYLFKNIQKDIAFTFFDGEFESQVFTLKTLPKPLLLSFFASINYPSYLQKKSTTIENNGDLVVPEGSPNKVDFSY